MGMFTVQLPAGTAKKIHGGALPEAYLWNIYLPAA
jgi:hypothetical protein